MRKIRSNYLVDIRNKNLFALCMGEHLCHLYHLHQAFHQSHHHHQCLVDQSVQAAQFGKGKRLDHAKFLWKNLHPHFVHDMLH